jgi:hypothetical protein
VPDFLTELQSYESGGRNIPNTTQGTSSGQAQGYNQITTGTWKEFGGTAYAPTPLQATQAEQNAIAAKIPLARWAPETLAYLRNKGFSLNPHATLADNIASNQGSLGVAPQPHGMTLNSVPMDPSIMAHGGVAPSVSRETPPAAAPTLGQSLAKGDVGAALATLTANKDDKPGTSALDKLAGLTKPKEQAQQAQAPQMLPAQDQTAMIAPAAQQLLAATFANSAKPLSWTTRPYGYDAGPQGLTLNSGAQNV